MRIAVTGASGFVGGAIARAAREAGHEVLALARRDPKLGVEFHPWDIRQPAPTSVLREGERVDAVVHTAAAVDDWVSLKLAKSVNVDGTVNVMRAFPNARFVHISSSSIYPPRRPSINIAEESITIGPHIRYLNSYGLTKAAAEEVVRGAVQNLRLVPGAVILRPHAIYGPGDRTLLPRIEAAVRNGNLWLPGGGRAAQNLTHISNLTKAALEAAKRSWHKIEQGVPAEKVVAINVTDSEPLILADALTEVLARRGSRVRVREIPLSAAWGIAAGLEAGARLVRSSSAPQLTRYLVAQLGYQRTYDLRRLNNCLGIQSEPTDFSGSENW